MAINGGAPEYAEHMLRVRLLGPMEVERDGEPVPAPASRRAWALLAWLALHPGEHARGHVAAQFWPDVLDSSARASLRSAVWALRRALGPNDEVVAAGRERLGLQSGADLWVDVHAFDEHVAAGRPAEAAELVRGDLLAGFDDEWALQARDEFRNRLSDVLERLAGEADSAGDAEAAIGWTRRRTKLDPLDEAAHRDLMSRLAANGDRAGAIAVHARLRERLGRELGVAPPPATRELAERLRHAETEAAGRDAEAEPVAAGARTLPLTGRERELRDLLDRWGAVRAGAGGVVTVTGEPGIGKTRLATELLARAHSDGARVASCAALDLGGAAPLGLWAELIRELSRDLAPPPLESAWPTDLSALAPDVERRFGREPTDRPAAAPDLERARLFEAVVELVEWAATSRPLVVLMEDLHLADAPSLELAGYVARRIRRLPVLMVLTRRPLPERAEADALEHALRARGVLIGEVALGPLAPDALARLVTSVAPLQADEIDQVVAAADGNALLAVERARAIGRGEREPPASLRGAVRVALSGLDDDARLVAEFAAVAGRELTGDEQRALPVADPPRAASHALQTGLLAGRGTALGYRHALLRDAVYAELAAPQRAWLHETLAGALAEREDPGLSAEVARHLRLAGRNDLAGAQLKRAAEHARSLGALDEAAGFLEEALEIGDADPALLLELAEIEAWRSRTDASDVAFERALELPGWDGRSELADAWMRRANWYRGPLCVPREVLQASRRVLELLGADPQPDASLLHEALAACAWAEAVAGDPAQAEELLAEVHRRGGGEQGDELLMQAIANARAFALIRGGRFTEAYAPTIAGGEASMRANRPDLSYGAWLNGACAASCAGDFERALEFIDRGREALAGRGLIGLEIHYLAARSYVLTRLGRLDEAQADADEEEVLAERIDNRELRATAEHDRGLVALARREYDTAAELLARALDHDAPVSRPLARLARAEALIRLGRCDEAEEELRATALEPVGPSDFPDTLVPRLTRLQGLIAAAKGDHDLAERRLEEAAEGWRRRLDRSADGDRYAATLADLGRPPVAGLVEPDRELERVLEDLRALEKTMA